MRKHKIILPPLGLFFLMLSSCWLASCEKSKQNETVSFSQEEMQLSHNKMVRLLDSLDNTANPRVNYHMNSERAAYYKQLVSEAKEPSKHVELSFQYALQLMYAAKIDQSIAVLTALLEQYNINPYAVKPNLRPLIEYLGIAYLRKGELDNCVVNHVSTSCIVPLDETAYHQLSEGSKNAVQLFTTLLQQYPNEESYSYWLNLAYMTLGEYPHRVPTAYRVPSDLFAPDSFPAFTNSATDLAIDVNSIAGGVVMEDFNGDGRFDLMVSSYHYGDPIHLFMQTATGFTDQSDAAGLTGITGGLHLMPTDYNNDGHTDVWVMRGGWLGNGGKLPNSLLHNQGDGTFKDVTHLTGLLSMQPTQTSVWADFNNDGWLDLFIGNESGQFIDANGQGALQTTQVSNPCQLFMNSGDGTFSEVSAAWNADIVGFIKGVALGDYNNDGWMDVYVSRLDGNNLLLRNEKGQSFSNQAEIAGVQAPLQSFPCTFWDVNNDGWDDIFVAGYDVNQLHTSPAGLLAEFTKEGTVTSQPKLYINQKDGTFKDQTVAYALNKSLFAMGLNFGDIDNDGWLDLYVGTGTPNLNSITPNRMFRNNSGKRFEEVSNAGFAHIQKGHGISFGDIDNDGDQDIYAVMGGAYEGDFAQNVLFENPGNTNAWIRLTLQGTNSNRLAIGAKVEVVVRNKLNEVQSIWRTVSSGASFGANSLPLEIGLGQAQAIEQIKITWPSGDVKTYLGPIALRQSYRLYEDSKQVEVKPLPVSDWQVLSPTHEHHD